MGSRSTVKRADALRSIDAIVKAAAECLGQNPEASLSEIARAAGVGRVTLYAHFASRAEVVDAAMSRAVDRGNQALDAVDLAGDPLLALARYVEASWRLVDQARALLVAAQRELPPGRIRELHSGPAARVETLIARGRSEGVFRTDLPIAWLVNVLHSVMHSAADEIRAGRLTSEHAAGHITATVLAAFTPPGRPVPEPGAGT
ncbi:TetR/AcrR family transcriptional regulator [Streptomyces coelicoflavus]|uniref:TetR/AcrR family transcriptional regulator n=2 Tax=Streptomyces TaxID=1883 RepID=A0A369UYT0_9ACTN|nr:MULTISPECIES: TetR/AcrR family transcriptional regulator [Streptomyces]MYS46227.1 TetR family transcriptional regulator [Streptomyces sp. SID5998]WDI21559.1 TetR/AcrR family transcriptional regulator [Streptomyces enissocaesilis]AIV33305.1 TetR family transcriptional regulator [Streptomyces sp. CCM_MD2014]MCT7351771.1 TetR/AcrR family transcriptional regulator [Streptomyces sp. 15-116A]MCW1097692.1 TetR/AcrR family transcriptional regulator [Streptomyces sp. RS2]